MGTSDVRTESRALWVIAEALVQRWRTILTVAVVLGLLTGGTARLSRQYMAESKFLPQRNEGDVGRLGGLAAQFGFNLGTLAGMGGESIDFYATLVKSREVLLQTAQTTYRVPRSEGSPDSISGTAVELLHVKGRSDADIKRNAFRAMNRRVLVGTNTRAGVVVVQTVAPTRDLAVKLNRRLLELVNEFNITRRQTQAGAERRFAEQRMESAEDSLHRAQDRLRGFVERNRRTTNSPELQLDRLRLQQDMEFKQQVYASLAQSLEQARLAEIRNTPVITIVESPDNSAEPNVSVVLNAVLGFLVGLCLGLGWVLLRLYWDQRRSEDPLAYERLRSLAAEKIPGWRRRA